MSEAQGARDELRIQLPATPSALAELREQLAAFLDAHAVSGDVSHTALLVGHELAANAIAHGSSTGDEIDVQAEIRDDRLCIVVSDPARGAGVPVALTPDELREGGRGLQVVGQLTEWSENIVGGRREVRAELVLNRAA